MRHRVTNAWAIVDPRDGIVWADRHGRVECFDTRAGARRFLYRYYKQPPDEPGRIVSATLRLRKQPPTARKSCS